MNLTLRSARCGAFALGRWAASTPDPGSPLRRAAWHVACWVCIRIDRWAKP